MATRIIRIKNTGLGGTWNGVTIIAGTYYTIAVSETFVWRNDVTVVKDISSGRLVVNKGANIIDDIINIVDALNWLSDELNPTRSVDGDLSIVQENNAHITGNNVINWNIEEFLNFEQTYSEKFIIPAGRTATINFLQGGSYDVPTYVSLEYFEMINGVMERINPDIRPAELPMFTLKGAHTLGTTVVSINDINGLLSTVDLTSNANLYCFDDGTNIIYSKIISIDTTLNTITLLTPLSVPLADLTPLTNVSRVIGQKGTQISSSDILWTSPPRFFGDGISYLQITIENKDTINSGFITAILNGWHTSTALGG